MQPSRRLNAYLPLCEAFERRTVLADWRLLKLETHDAFMNMAIDEAVLTARIENRVPNTLRLYCWKPSAVSVGKFQLIEKEVQVDNCRKLGVDVVRRITGGGAVYHDAEDEITYSVVATKESLGTQDVAAVYAKIYAGLVEALKILGITADFNEGNAKTCPNLTVRGKKISGSAQCHKNDVVLQHGTLLLDVSLKRMFELLRVRWAKTCMEVVNVAKDRITSVNSELERTVPREKVGEALIDGFQKGLNTRLAAGELTLYERELTQRLCMKKYCTDNWNMQAKDSPEK
jgi:lipoate-protein ligase A